MFLKTFVIAYENQFPPWMFRTWEGAILTFLWIPTEKQMTYAPKKLAGNLLNFSQISFRKFIKTLFGNGQVLTSHSARGKSVTLFKKLFGYLG